MRLRRFFGTTEEGRFATLDSNLKKIVSKYWDSKRKTNGARGFICQNLLGRTRSVQKKWLILPSKETKFRKRHQNALDESTLTKMDQNNSDY